MSILTIDTDQTSTYYDELVQLEGLEYLFEFSWSDRESSWYLNIYDQDESPIAVGVKLVLNTKLLRRFQDTRLPPGLLFCNDLSGTGQDMTQSSDLGVNVEFVYVTSDDEALATTTPTSGSSLAVAVSSSLAITPSPTSVSSGSSTALTATESPSGADVTASVIWSSGDASIATVDSSGNVTGTGTGVVAITATYDGILTAVCYVTVTGAM